VGLTAWLALWLFVSACSSTDDGAGQAADGVSGGDLGGQDEGGAGDGATADVGGEGAGEEADTCTPSTEVCNGVDDDCDGEIDEGFPDENESGVADCVEEDFDFDGIPDEFDNCPKVANSDQLDLDQDTIGNLCDDDIDGDKIINDGDNCPESANFPQDDTDEDGIGDACDPDDDNDEVLDGTDNCPITFNPAQADNDGNGVGDVCEDTDGDKVFNNEDNCPATTNPSQLDLDGDDIGDECDDDDDDDGVVDADDNCTPSKHTATGPGLAGYANPGQEDVDNDGTGDKCDADNDNDKEPDKTDCGPLDPEIYPDADELCDGKDNNCNDQTDEGFGLGAPCGTGACAGGVIECLTLSSTICSTAAEGSNPATFDTEVCNGVDDDCDGDIDEGFGIGSPCGLGICEGGVIECDTESTTICSTLFGGSNQKQLPLEYCNGLDDTCDGKTPAQEADADEDTFRICDGDCDDDMPTVNPDAIEVCDFVDNDCNEIIDDGKVCEGSIVIGSVYDAISFIPLSGVQVRLLDVLCIDVLMTTNTDTEGKYAFPALDGPGTYCVDVTFEGYWDTYSEDVLVPPVPWPTLIRVDFGMKPKGAKANFSGVAGKVMDPDLNELEEVSISIDAAGVPLASDSTDANGNYAVVGLAPNLVSVTASKPGYFPKTVPVILYPNQTMIQNFTLEPFVGASLAGKVTDVNGNNVLDADIVVKAGAEVQGSDISDKFGDYAISGLESGTFQATASKAGYKPQNVTVVLEEGETTFQDFLLEPLPPKVGCFSDDFETPKGWEASGLWHTINNSQNLQNAYGCPSCSGAVALIGDWKIPKCQSKDKCVWYGLDSNGSFCVQPYETGPGSGCNGSATQGTYTSPPFELGDYDTIMLSFWTWWEIESVNPHTYDLLTIELSQNNGPFQQLVKLNPPADPVGIDKAKKPFTNNGYNTSPEWTLYKLNLSSYANKTVRLRFRFNSSDGLYNGFRGWLIDNLVVECE
jgi:hypothetical protein